MSASGVSGARRVVRLGGEDQRGGDVPRGRVSERREPRPDEAATATEPAANARSSARGRRVQSPSAYAPREKKRSRSSWTNATHIPSRPSTPRRFAPARPRAHGGFVLTRPRRRRAPGKEEPPEDAAFDAAFDVFADPRRPPPDERSPSASLRARRRSHRRLPPLSSRHRSTWRATSSSGRSAVTPGARSTPKRSMRVAATDASLSARKRRNAAPSEAFRSSRSSDDVGLARRVFPSRVFRRRQTRGGSSCGPGSRMPPRAFRFALSRPKADPARLSPRPPRASHRSP